MRENSGNISAKKRSLFGGKNELNTSLKAKRESKQNVWFGVGIMGIIGWSVIVPTLLGVAVGTWLDKGHQGSHSWTLILMLIGLAIGCLNAWHWATRQVKKMQNRQENS